MLVRSEAHVILVRSEAHVMLVRSVCVCVGGWGHMSCLLSLPPSLSIYIYIYICVCVCVEI